MNKQDFQQKIKDMKPPKFFTAVTLGDAYEAGFEEAKYNALYNSCFLNEPKKPVIPKYVADWIEWCKKHNVSLLGSIIAVCNNKNIRVLDASGWAYKNQETFTKAWFYGYEVEKKKLYLASFRDTNQYLGWNEKLGEWFMSGTPFTSGVKQTQETWEGVGIWNNPAFEIKEVEE